MSFLSSFSGRPSQRRRAAFTLAEMMVAVSVFAVALGLFYESFRSRWVRTIKSVSLNDSNAALQTSFARIQALLESKSILVDCANYDPVAKTFTAATDGTWANGVRFMTLQPVVGYILPDDGSTGVQSSLAVAIDNPPLTNRPQTFLHTDSQTNPNKITFSYDSKCYPMANVTLPSSARFYAAFPLTYETTTGTSPSTSKPGLGISAITFSDTGYNSTGIGKAVVTLTNPMTATVAGRKVSDCTRGYLLVEGALVVLPDYTGGPKKLLYFSDTNQPSNSVVVSLNVDGANQAPPDTPTTPVTGNFCHAAGDTAVETILPIRQRDYSNALLGASRGGAQADTNAWIRLTTKFRNRQTL